MNEKNYCNVCKAQIRFTWEIFTLNGHLSGCSSWDVQGSLPAALILWGMNQIIGWKCYTMKLFKLLFGVKRHQIKQDNRIFFFNMSKVGNWWLNFKMLSQLTTHVLISVFCSTGCVNVHACLMLFKEVALTDKNSTGAGRGVRVTRGKSVECNGNMKFQHSKGLVMTLSLIKTNSV